ncbi:putative methyltransferase [Helianthus anomalus]
MSVLFLSAPPSISVLSHRSTTTTTVTCCSSLQTLPQPQPSLSSPLSSNSLLTNSKTSSGCSLNCPHFDSCSGCTHEDNLHRPVVLQEATTFFKKLGVSDFTFDTCRLWGWRCRAKLAIRGSSTDPLIGLYEEGTHNVVDIPDCKGIKILNIEPYDEDERTGYLRYVQMAVTTYNTSLPASERYRSGRVQVSLVWNARSETSASSEKLNNLATFLWRNGGPNSKVHLIHSVWANFQTSTNNVIFGNRWRHLLGERDFWEHVGGIDVYLPPSSFGQANTRAFDSLLQKLHKYVPIGSSVTDLYAGAGVIGLSLASTRKCRKEMFICFRCVEINKESKLAFEKTIDRLPSSLDSSISWHHADTSIEPLSWLVGSDILVVDPPRKGLDPSLIGALRDIKSAERKAMTLESPTFKAKDEKRPWILRAREDSVQIPSRTTQEENRSLPQTLIYISCGWESFREVLLVLVLLKWLLKAAFRGGNMAGRNCTALLSSKAWHLSKAHGFNFFPGTQSIEILAVFKRGPGASVKKKKSGKKKKKNTLEKQS